MAVFGGNRELLDAFFLVAVNSGEPENELLWSRQTPDNVIRRA
jgi:hypothetical protein